jgi:hypothetical protein
MAKKYSILLGVAVVALVLLVRLLAVGHETPSGQSQLMAITPQSLPQFVQEFNQSAEAERVVLLMSPTCPVCLDGSSQVEAILERHAAGNIRVFAVWEPMLPTDWVRPSTRVLKRMSDPRVIQIWDSNHMIAKLVERGASGRKPRCCHRNGAWWDVIATYPPGTQWSGSAPTPELLDGTIVQTAPQLDAQLERHW